MRADITKQETLPISAMPPFGSLLSAQQCADIAAWLQAWTDVHYRPEPKERKRPASFQRPQDRR